MHMSMYMWRTCMHMDMYVRVYMSLYMPYTCTTRGHVHAMYMCVLTVYRDMYVAMYMHMYMGVYMGVYMDVLDVVDVLVCGWARALHVACVRGRAQRR